MEEKLRGESNRPLNAKDEILDVDSITVNSRMFTLLEQ